MIINSYCEVLLDKVDAKSTLRRPVVQSARHPKAKVVFMSGYTEDVLDRSGAQRSQIAFLSKPFSLQDLVSKLNGLLASADAF